MRSYAAEDWARVRAKGRGAYLLRNGFLGRGLPLGAVMAVAVEAMRGGTFPEALATPRFYLLLLFTVAVFTVSGCIAAWASWNLHERRHAEGQ